MDAPPNGWLTLTEAATRTGHTREAVRARIRRGSLPSSKGNDGQLRVQARNLDDLSPMDAAVDDPERFQGPAMAALLQAMAGLRTTVDELRATLAVTMDKAMAGHLADHGRAERAEAQAAAEAGRAARAEAQLVMTEAALAEARTPWAIRVIRAWRRPSA